MGWSGRRFVGVCENRETAVAAWAVFGKEEVRPSLVGGGVFRKGRISVVVLVYPMEDAAHESCNRYSEGTPQRTRHRVRNKK